MKPLFWLPIALFCGFLALVGVGVYRGNDGALPSARVGQLTPPVTVAELGAKPLLTEEFLRAPGVKIVNFWASWCAPCRAEHAQLMTLASEGVPVFGVNYKDLSASSALGFLDELGDPYSAIGTDLTGRTMALDWGVYGIPETYIIDGAGVIRYRFAGPILPSNLKNIIHPALDAARSN